MYAESYLVGVYRFHEELCGTVQHSHHLRRITDLCHCDGLRSLAVHAARNYHSSNRRSAAYQEVWHVMFNQRTDFL